MTPGDLTGLGRDSLIRMLHLYAKRIQELEERVKVLDAELRERWKDIADLEYMIRKLTEEEGRKA